MTLWADGLFDSLLLSIDFALESLALPAPEPRDFASSVLALDDFLLFGEIFDLLLP